MASFVYIYGANMLFPTFWLPAQGPRAHSGRSVLTI